MTKQPKHVIPAKIVIILVPVIIILYLINTNFLLDQTFSYNYNVGTENKNYISPNTRISEPIQKDNINYREAIGHILYYGIPISQRAESIIVQIKIKDNLPKDEMVILGARNNLENWSYSKHEVYTSTNSNEWIILETEFNMEEEQLTPKNNKLSLILWFPHLAQEQYKNYTIPIDYINITIYKPGIL